MASIQPRGGKWQLRVKHKLLPKPFFYTFASQAEAQAYAAQLESLLDRGIVPAEMLGTEKRGENPLLSKLIADYLATANVAPSDRATLDLLTRTKGNDRLGSVNATWADLWVSQLKVADKLAPSTIRKRVEALARVIDAYWRARHQTPANPLRMMPRGYASASAAEATRIRADGHQVKRDVARDRRLSLPECQAIDQALAGIKRIDRERALPTDPPLRPALRAHRQHRPAPERGLQPARRSNRPAALGNQRRGQQGPPRRHQAARGAPGASAAPPACRLVRQPRGQNLCFLGRVRRRQTARHIQIVATLCNAF
jgi:hypothetical protein